MMMTMMIRIKEISDVSRSSQVQNQTTPKWPAIYFTHICVLILYTDSSYCKV
jgi:hypothetical protein